MVKGCYCEHVPTYCVNSLRNMRITFCGKSILHLGEEDVFRALQSSGSMTYAGKHRLLLLQGANIIEQHLALLRGAHKGAAAMIMDHISKSFDKFRRFEICCGGDR